MARRLAAVAMVSAALLVAAQAHAQEAQEELPDLPGLYAAVLTAAKTEEPNRRLVLDISRRWWRPYVPGARLPEDHVPALLERTAVVHAVCDSEPEGRREQPCDAPGIRDGAFFVSLGPVGRMQPNGEVVASAHVLVPVEGRGIRYYEIKYVLKRRDEQWVVDRVAERIFI